MMRSLRLRALPLLALACALGLPALAQAQSQAQGPGRPDNYPSRTVRMIVGFEPGGGTDILSRIVSQKLGEHWGHSVITENRPGASGVLSLDLVQQAAPDGHTILVAANSLLSTTGILKKVKYDVQKAYAPIVAMSVQPYLLLVHTALPISTVKELIAYAKSNPGKLNYGSSGTGSAAHLGMELFKDLSGADDIVHIPFKGSGQALTALVGGQIQLALTGIVSGMPHARSGKLKALGTTGAARLQAQPDLPTVAEGGLPGYELSNTYGLLAPAGTPPAILAAFNREVSLIVNSPELKAKLAADGSEPAPANTPEQYRESLAKEIAKWERLVKATGIKME
jgi:tripartite-type tricarboxylate transporter receptor subunit TctC